MESIAVFASFTTITRSYKNLYRSLSRITVLRKHYGLPRALILYFFACDAWRVETKLLLSGSNKDAEAFKRTQENECAMTAIVASILAQMNVTAVQIILMKKVPLAVGLFWMSSFVSALVAMCYSAKQLKAIGRLLRPEQVRTWIRSKGDGLRNIHHKEAAGFAQVPLPAFTSVLLVATPGLMLSSSVTAFILGLLGEFVYGAVTSPPGVEKDRFLEGTIGYVVMLVVNSLVYGQVGLLHTTEGGDSALEEVLVALRAHFDGEMDSETQAPPSAGSLRSRADTIVVDLPLSAVGEEPSISPVLALREATKQCQECASALRQVAECFDGAAPDKNYGPFAPIPSNDVG